VFWFNNRTENPEHNPKSIKVVIILVAIQKKDGTGREALKGGYIRVLDRLCGLVVRVSGYRYRGLVFDPRRYEIF
jgi:hypothetical protein